MASMLSFGPRALIAGAALADTGLVQPGSQIVYHYRLTLPAGVAPEAWSAATAAPIPDAGWRIRRLDDAAPGVRRFIDRMTLFLTFVGLTALLIGGIGIGNGVKSYLDGRVATIATFKCLGATGRLVFTVYLIQILGLACGGVVLGLLIGAVAPVAAPAPRARAAAGAAAPRPLSGSPAVGGGVRAADGGDLRPVAAGPGSRRAGRQSVPRLRGAARRPAAWPLRRPGGGRHCRPRRPDRRRGRRDARRPGVRRRRAGRLRRAARRRRPDHAPVRPHRPAARRRMAAGAGQPAPPRRLDAPSVVVSLGLGWPCWWGGADPGSTSAARSASGCPKRRPPSFFIDIQPDQVAAFDKNRLRRPQAGNYRRVPSLRGRIVRDQGRHGRRGGDRARRRLGGARRPGPHLCRRAQRGIRGSSPGSGGRPTMRGRPSFRSTPIWPRGSEWGSATPSPSTCWAARSRPGSPRCARSTGIRCASILRSSSRRAPWKGRRSPSLGAVHAPPGADAPSRRR